MHLTILLLGECRHLLVAQEAVTCSFSSKRGQYGLKAGRIIVAYHFWVGKELAIGWEQLFPFQPVSDLWDHKLQVSRLSV